ncbi:hypothetical protein HPC49_21595 [Pyxidicoccus fallax]|uniref:Lipoprotein n=1 Tax=Pyxidicoccus fallax TaxID=394095 RepID=A0A848LHG3_9BACT|nr:hypothetical protein [Pyxidicoccus fallax]NMO16611.1 hypothetical protein [Pyxidicoccus fallax]NPC80806.1 hypothetical protein [Pyxidicoccus fallax]
MRASSLTLPLLALLATGCKLMPEDSVFLYGDVRLPDGSPAGGSLIQVDRAQADLDDWNNPGDPDQRVWNYEPYTEVTAEASGGFTLETLAGDLRTEGYTREGFEVTVRHRFRVYPPLASDGSGVFAVLYFEGDVDLPTLRPWDWGLTVGDGLSLSFAAAPPAPETPPTATLGEAHVGSEHYVLHPTTPSPVLQLQGGAGLVWHQSPATSPWAPSAYVLEDFDAVEAQVRASSDGLWYFEPLGASSSGLDFRLEWRSPRAALPRGTLRPVSRGMTCSPAPVDRPCPFTDGRLEPVLAIPAGGTEDDAGVEALTFSLNAPTRLSRVVVRNLDTTMGYLGRLRVVVEGSVDGGAWVTLGNFLTVLWDTAKPSRGFPLPSMVSANDSPFGEGPIEPFTPHLFLDAPLMSELPVRLVRLRVTSEGGGTSGKLVKLGEVSLFE